MNFITAACISSSWFELIPILLSHLTTLTYLCIGKLLSKTICDLEIMKAIEYCSLLDKWILQFTYFRKDLMKRLWMLFAHFVWFKNWFFWNWKKKWGVYPNKWISKATSPQAQFLIPLICKTKCSVSCNPLPAYILNAHAHQKSREEKWTTSGNPNLIYKIALILHSA